MKIENFEKISELIEEVTIKNHELTVLSTVAQGEGGFQLSCKADAKYTQLDVSLEDVLPIIQSAIKTKTHELDLLEAKLELL